MAAIDVRGLTKRYGDVLANDEVSFAVDSGEVFGYLGPNGAGKTTTLRTLVGLLSPTAGTATVLGADVRDEAALVAARRRVGYLPSTPQFDDRATGRAVLDLHAAVAGAPRREELLALFDVPLDRRVRSYSTGQRQQLGLVRTFAHDPDLAIMDEPTAGLDPLVQARFESFVRAERRAGTTVLLSSHVLGEVRRLCDRVAVIRDGRIVAVEDVEALVDRSGKLVRVRVAGDLDPAALSLSGVHDRSTRTVEHAGAPDSTDDPEAPGDATAPDGPDADRVTELSFTYTGDVDALVDALADYHLLDLDVEEAPLERVFARFYDDGERDPLEESERVDATPAGAGRGRAPGQREERQ